MPSATFSLPGRVRQVSSITLFTHAVVGADRAQPERAAAYAGSVAAPATRQAYERDSRVFASWCATRVLQPMPAEPATIAALHAAEADREFRP